MIADAAALTGNPVPDVSRRAVLVLCGGETRAKNLHRLLEEKGEALFAAWHRRLTEFDQGIQGLRHLRVLGHGREAGAHYPGIFALDPAKILISTQGTGLTGVALRDLLRREYRIEVEMALDRSLADNLHDWASVKARVREALSSYIYRRPKRSPMILPILMEV